MVIVSVQLIHKNIDTSSLLKSAFKLLEEDVEVSELLRISNTMAVTRLRYNDHGIMHARIVAGIALELLDILMNNNVIPTTLRDGTTKSIEEAKLVVLMASYFHDIGNAVHRVNHEYIGTFLAKDLLNRLLPKLGFADRRVIALRQEIMHAIYATEYNTKCLTVECGVVKVSDGLDMAEGRARIPYRLGKLDMHALSAITIKKVEVEQGTKEKPIKIVVHMDEYAGVFQLEEVLVPKIKTSGIGDYIEVYISTPTRQAKFYPISATM
ncbi:MAG: HD domain-containing protein [Ignisphaera sp.]|uniref:HD domain-containing protein n=1 Tax=Ignisphaera aggregans TaxID=334771 RepID=A0A7C4JKV8_9CREN